MNSEFFNRKFINGWGVTKEQSYHPLFRNAKQGDVAFVYNDSTSKTGRRVSFLPVSDYWYFYIKKNDENIEFLKKYKIKTAIGNNWIRCYYPKKQFKDPELIQIIKDFEEQGIKTYEADIGPMKRICLDKNVQIEDFDKIRVLYMDIETDDSKGGIVIGRDRILSFAGVDQNGKEFYLTHQNEEVLLNQINELISQFDMLIGWNSKVFDLPYIMARMKLYRIPTDYVWNILHEDMMRRVQYFYSKDPDARQEISNYSLQSISEYFLKEGKKEYSGKIIDLFNDKPEVLKAYNIQDCRLLKKLEDKLGTIRLTYDLSQTCQIFAQNWSMIKNIDNFILSDANKKGVHYRTNLNYLKNGDEEEVEMQEYLGALVLDPVPGYYENVYDLDFKSLYPNIIRTFNISPETLLPDYEILNGKISYTEIPKITIDGKEKGGKIYNNEILGIIPGKIGILLDDREKIRKKMKDLEKGSDAWKNLNVKQLIVKELANSIYGVLGNQYFREFNIELAESITVTGQFLITWVKTYLEKTGRKVIYGDTDSVFVTLKGKEKIEDVLEDVNKGLTKILKDVYGVKNSTIELAFDVKFDQFIIESKKKYVGKIGNKVKYVGMECIKRDTIPVAVNYQKKLIEQIFEGKTTKEIKKWVDEKKKIILTKDFKVEDITIRKKLSKDPKEYKAKSERTYTAPQHVRIAKENGNKSGDIIQYIIADGKGGKINEAVPVSKFKGKWDRVYYFNNVVYPILDRMLKTIFPDENWDKYYIDDRIIKPKKQLKLL